MIRKIIVTPALIGDRPSITVRAISEVSKIFFTKTAAVAVREFYAFMAQGWICESVLIMYNLCFNLTVRVYLYVHVYLYLAATCIYYGHS